MAANRRLETDRDFQEAIEKETPVRVFRDDHMIDSDSIVIRFDDTIVVTQYGVSRLAYHRRDECEFFEMRKR